MRCPVLLVAMVTLVSAHPLRAQQPRQDSATVRRARRPLLRWGEVIGVVAVTGLTLATDQSIRDRLNDPHDRLGRTLSDIGNGFGDPVIVYGSLFALSAGSKLLAKKSVYGVTSRALKSALLGGGATMVLKSITGRDRPVNSIDDPYSFHLFRIGDNSLPSGHATVAFALATSFARETPDKWTDLGFFTLATLTAYSRMHDDKHWASDVVLGAGVGILSARFVHRFQARVAVAPGGFGMSLAF
jgi:membrane-associated phospholipid phosphatase